MSSPLRVLFVEDNEDDVLLVALELRRAGYDVAQRRVQTAEAMREALAQERWDVVVSDFAMPQFNGLQALDIARAYDEDIPFLIVSGAIGEETAAGLMRSGAQDYVMKGNYARLIPAIERELREAESRRKHKRAQEERRRLEAQMQQAQKLESLGILAGGIAHDFNNLLTVILGNADLALMEMSPFAPARHSLENIQKAGQRAANLARQMLAYSGKSRLVVQSVDLNELVREMGRLLEISIPSKVTLKYELADAMPPIVADVAQLQQIIMNLITNASEAIGEQMGAISLRTGVKKYDRVELAGSVIYENQPEGMYVVMEVSDTGCGMDAETMSKIFDPFFTTKFTGRGLGLAATLGIVRGHRGAILTQSEPGRGTTFRVLIPVYDPAGANGKELFPGAGVMASEISCDTIRAASPLVLLADDNENIVSLVSRMLTHAGFRILTAANGRETVERFRERPEEIACVLLDLTMPLMDGLEAFRELRRIKPDVRVVLASGYHEEEAMRRFAGGGWAGFLSKPYQMTTLIDELKRVLKL
ncbi:MAG: response regulator [Candidatus Sumerlaeota bacterium]|nr:response regulator [Candidatus Sumerlaeota bacterium]